VSAPKSKPDETMNSRVPWSAEAIDPIVRERAEAAALRAGMSLNDWLKATIGDITPPDFATALAKSQNIGGELRSDVADIHQRLDSITRQIEQISRPARRAGDQGGVANQLNEAISRLDARLSQIVNPGAARHAQLRDQQRQAEIVERAAARSYRSPPPLSNDSLDLTIAEIAARQGELDAIAFPQTPPVEPPTPPAGPPPPGPDFSSLERHLLNITSQIEALQCPDGIEHSIAAFRSELAEIRLAITEAMPRRAIESIENEVRSLSRRIDDTRLNATDTQALAGIERALGEIREVLGSLTPAEQLAGYDEAIRNLGAKLDLILRANDDPSTVRQLESAITALRAIVSNVASTDALSRLSTDVHTLSSKVDQLPRSENSNDSFAILEKRIAALTSTLESRQSTSSREGGEQLENALRALSDRIDRMPAGNDNASAFAHLEQRVTYLLERLEASADQRGSVDFGPVEDGLQDILRHLEQQHGMFAALSEISRSPAQPADSDFINLVKRELSDVRFNQTEADRHTQDSLEAVHNTLGHVVDRLAMIEGDLRQLRDTPGAPLREPPPLLFESPPLAPPVAVRSETAPQQPRPELPNPAAAQTHFDAAPRDFQAAMSSMAMVTPHAISEILEPRSVPARSKIEPELPPDHPLEPGTRPSGRATSPAERIAASESAISELTTAPREKASTSSFIAAARRAAQAAAAAAPAEKGRAPLKSITGHKVKQPSNITSKIRAVLVAASVVIIVLATFRMAMTLLESGTAPQFPAADNSSASQPSAQSPADAGDRPAMQDASPPSMTSPTPLGRQSLYGPTPTDPDAAGAAIAPVTPAPLVAPVSSKDITGSLAGSQTRTAGRRIGLVQVPPTERLPDGIGGPQLRAAALKGDATAAYEVAMRFAEGKGIATNYDEAAKWYDRAAQAGVVPAIFRLGTFYEKGLSVTKDVDIARRYYLQAAERGNAKAMHNLAVLDADGGGKGANYASASQWFRKAADRGIADSQFNLGILYARGIGVEQNLAEAFKWFSLAASQGDADASRKRDDIAKRLDAQSLAAANLAIQTFTPEPQPDDAVKVAAPVGGWDSAPPQANTERPGAKPVSIKRASR
jgi:localization factor PodJL